MSGEVASISCGGGDGGAPKFTAFSFDSEMPQSKNNSHNTFVSKPTSNTIKKELIRSDLKRQEKLMLADNRKQSSTTTESYSTLYMKQQDNKTNKNNNNNPQLASSAGINSESVELHMPLKTTIMNSNNNSKTDKSAKFSSLSPGERGMGQQLKNASLYLYGLSLFCSMVLFFILSMCFRQLVKGYLLCFYGTRIRLMERPTDALWGYETESSSSNIVLIFKCEGVPDMERIIDDFERKVMGFRTLLRADGNADGIYDMYAPYEKLRWIIKEKFLFYCLEKDEEFSVRNHFFMEKVMDEGNNVDERIEAVCGSYLEYKLDPMKPQWEFRVIAPIPAGGTSTEWGLVFCVHHGYGDGLSWLQMLRHCLADEHVALPLEPLTTPKSSVSTVKCNNNSKKSTMSKFCQMIHHATSVPHTFACEITKMVQESNAFHGPMVKGQKSCSWTHKSIPLKMVKDIKQQNGKPALFTSVILSCATKAFQRSFHNCNSRLPYEILSGVPYADLPYKNLVPLNNFSMTLFALPTRIVHDRQQRLMTTEKIVQRAVATRQAEMNQILTSMGGSLISPLLKLSSSLAAKSTMGLSNLPGPQEKFRLFGGQCVTKVLLFPPMKFRTAVNLGVFSYCGNVNISLAVDGTITEKYPKFPELFLKYMEEELDQLVQDSQQFSKQPVTGVITGSSEDIVIDCDMNNNKENVNDATVATIII